MENRVLPLNKNTLSKLIQKNPKGKAASQDILLNGPLQIFILSSSNQSTKK